MDPDIVVVSPGRLVPEPQSAGLAFAQSGVTSAFFLSSDEILLNVAIGVTSTEVGNVLDGYLQEGFLGF